MTVYNKPKKRVRFENDYMKLAKLTDLRDNCLDYFTKRKRSNDGPATKRD